MSTIVTRISKGSALTWAEADANFTNLNTDKAELASPTFTGVPAVPTATTGTNTTQIASTAFVNTEIDADRPYSDTNPIMDSTAAKGTSPKISRQDHVHPSDTSKVAKAGDTMTGPIRIPSGQIGISSTTTENHFFDGSVANQLSLKRGTPEAPGIELIKALNGVLSFPNQGQSLTAAGYVKLPGGLVVQWGNGRIATALNGQTETFPIAFPTQAFFVIASQAGPSGSSGVIPFGTQIVNLSTFNIWALSSTPYFTWIAIGY